MRPLIDTNIAIHLRDGSSEIVQKLAAFDAKPVLSVVTRIELEGGVAARPHVAIALRRATDALLEKLTVLDFDSACANAYSAILSGRGYARGRVLDRMIAATALAHGLTLITINGGDFRDIPGLDLEIWPAAQ